jgi:hypothetical protein
VNPLIKHLLVTSQTTFDARGNANPTNVYSYYVLNHGPFVDKYTDADNTPVNVNLGFQKRIDALRAVGALPAGS